MNLLSSSYLMGWEADAETGDIVIATVNGTDATCKRLRKYKDGIELISNNPTYDPLDFSNQEIMEKPVRIIGKVVELRRKFQGTDNIPDQRGSRPDTR